MEKDLRISSSASMRRQSSVMSSSGVGGMVVMEVTGGPEFTRGANPLLTLVCEEDSRGVPLPSGLAVGVE